jgi:DNA-binding HxlR family transcriptional regulator
LKRAGGKSSCAVNFSLEAVGDPWSLLIVRDLVFYGKRTFGEFLASEERITSSVLADRLGVLVEMGVLMKRRSEIDGRRTIYMLTDKGLTLIPLLVELACWGMEHGPGVRTDEIFLEVARTDRGKLLGLIRATVAAGGAVFRGEESVIDQLRAGSSLPRSDTGGSTTAPRPANAAG